MKTSRCRAHGQPKIKVSSKVVDIRDLIKEDLRAIKKKDPDGDGKKQINGKEEQKILLKGRSPTLAMR